MFEHRLNDTRTAGDQEKGSHNQVTGSWAFCVLQWGTAFAQHDQCGTGQEDACQVGCPGTFTEYSDLHENG